MGSSYFGEPSMGNGRSAGSSRKGKKSSSNSDKPKQPQRGLGVAQLEKIRLHHQLGSNNYLHTSPNYHHLHHHHHTNLNQQEDVRMETVYSSVPSSSSSSSTSPSSFGFHHPNIMMGFRDMEGTDIRYGDPQSCTTTSRWNHNNGIIIETPFNTQPSLTRQLFSFQIEDSAQKKGRKDRCNSLGSSSQNSESSEMQELDLDLKL